MRPLRYDVNHSSTLPPIPYDDFRRRNKVAWSTVSNAADKSSNIMSPVSNADRMSLSYILQLGCRSDVQKRSKGP